MESTLGCASQGGVQPADLSPALSGATSRTRAPDPALIAARQRFKDAGYHHADADRYARISLGLKEDTDPPLKRCVYYKVEAFYCDSLSRRSATYYVGALCIEAALPNCVSLTVEGPFRTTDVLICNGLVDCSCWSGLACATATCAPYDQSLDAPKDCPKCP